MKFRSLAGKSPYVFFSVLLFVDDMDVREPFILSHSSSIINLST